MTAGEPVLHGAAYSVYVRTARLALEEKTVPYRLVPVDVFAPGGPPADHLARHPFGRIPSFEHDGFRLYETGAITRYVDEAFAGPPLQPAPAKARARMNQVIGILDAYAYQTLVWDLYMEQVSAPRRGVAPDARRIAAAMPRAATCLAALETLLGDAPWFGGDAVSLADLHAAPVFAYFSETPAAASLFASSRRLPGWWARIAARPSFLATPFAG